MLSQIHPSPLRASTATVGALVASLVICLTALPGTSAAASPAIPVTPFLDCVQFNGDQAIPVYTAYFGYNNTGPVQFHFAIGADNNVFPGSIDAGQPTGFNVGNYPRVFPVQFDGNFIREVSWFLNGATAVASASSPACTSGITAAASELGSTSATLNGVVTPDGQDTTYSFEYGTSPSFGTSTPSQDAGSGTQPQLVQTALARLVPSTQYFFRLDTTSALAGTTHGPQQSFTTPASVAQRQPLALSTTRVPHATFGMSYQASLAASGGTPAVRLEPHRRVTPAGPHAGSWLRTDFGNTQGRGNFELHRERNGRRRPGPADGQPVRLDHRRPSGDQHSFHLLSQPCILRPPRDLHGDSALESVRA